MNNTPLTQEQIITCNLIEQRKKFLSLLTPPPRYTPVSPYPQYTKQQLDMRRKVEVLQYKNNSSNSAQITKSKKWAQLSNTTNNRYVVCNKNYTLPTPTSSCDVPGPVTYLTYDPAVPLYNYTTSPDVYAKFAEVQTEQWNYALDVSNAKVNTTGKETNLLSLIIKNPIEKFDTFSLKLPIGMYISGTVNNISQQLPQNLKITKMVLNVYFYDGGVTATTPCLSIPITNSLTNTNIFDISMSFVPNVTFNSQNFSGSQFLGDIVIPTIQLPTYYGYIYDIRLYSEINYNNIYIGSDISNYVYGTYLNMPRYDTSGNNCTITPQYPPTITYYQPFFITSLNNMQKP